MEPYYSDDWATIYHGRCEDVLPTLGPVDLILTSPPYNLGVSTGGSFGHYEWNANMKARGGGGKWHGGDLANGYDGHDDAMPMEEYEAWQQDVLRACWAQLTEAGAIFYNHKPRVQAGTLWTPLRLNPDLPVRQIVVWARAGGVNFAPTHYLPTHEWIVVLAKPSWRLKSKGASGVGDVWTIPQESSTEHPCPFPLTLASRVLETVAPSVVLDPFMGSGTTLRAAKDAGIRAIGIDKSERYCEIAARRLAQEVLDFGCRVTPPSDVAVSASPRGQRPVDGADSGAPDTPMPPA